MDQNQNDLEENDLNEGKHVLNDFEKTYYEKNDIPLKPVKRYHFPSEGQTHSIGHKNEDITEVTTKSDPKANNSTKVPKVKPIVTTVTSFQLTPESESTTIPTPTPIPSTEKAKPEDFITYSRPQRPELSTVLPKLPEIPHKFKTYTRPKRVKDLIPIPQPSNRRSVLIDLKNSRVVCIDCELKIVETQQKPQKTEELVKYFNSHLR